MSRHHLSPLRGRTIRCILFDLGETLWTRAYISDIVWQKLEHAAYERMLAALRASTPPVSLPQVADIDTLGRQVRTTLRQSIRIAMQQDPYYEPDPIMHTIEALRQVGIADVSLELSRAVFEALNIRIPGSRTIFADAFPTLTELQRRGFLLGIVSNRVWGGTAFQEDLQTLGFFNYFDPRHVAISADLVMRKPNPAIFQHVLDALQVKAEEAVMVGDALLADVVGAERLSMLTVWRPKKRLHAELPEILPASQPSYFTEDDRIIAHARLHGFGKYAEKQVGLKPDFIIMHLRELLDIFIQAGEQ